MHMQRLSTADRLSVVASAATIEKAGPATDAAVSIRIGHTSCLVVYVFPLMTRSTVDHPAAFASIANGDLTRSTSKIASLSPNFIDSERLVQYECQGFRKYWLSEPHAALSYELGSSLPAAEELLNSPPRVSRSGMITFTPWKSCMSWNS
jgi:hypothetical protein